MNQLRLEADEASGKVEELQAKVKTLEQENLSKEQEITSLSHKNGILEGEVEKLEEKISEPKPMTFDAPQKSRAFPVPCHSSLKSPPVRRRLSVTWMA